MSFHQGQREATSILNSNEEDQLLEERADAILDVIDLVENAGDPGVLTPVPLGPWQAIQIVESVSIMEANQLLFEEYPLLSYYLLNEKKHQQAQRSDPIQISWPTIDNAGSDILRQQQQIDYSLASTHVPSDYSAGKALPITSRQEPETTTTQQRRLIPKPKPSVVNEKNIQLNRYSRQRTYQSDMWGKRFQELCKYKDHHGDCLVPHNWRENVPLAKWVKRQRYQYKLKKEGKHSTMSDAREIALEQVGFRWEYHKVAWEERLKELHEFREEKGHCNVPSTYPENPQLSVWVQCQRRQYKLYCKGERSYMTEERIEKLRGLDFVWDPRSAVRQQDQG